MDFWIDGFLGLQRIAPLIQNSNTPVIHQSNNPLLQNFEAPNRGT